MRNASYRLLLAGFLAACGSRTIGSLEGGASAGASNAAGGAGASGQVGVASSAGTGSAAGMGSAAGGADPGPSAGRGGDLGGASGGAGTAEAGAAGAGGNQAAPKALLLVDRRLYALLSDRLEQYVALAAQRRGFAIQVLAQDGLDELGFLELKALLSHAYQDNPALEGALFVGNLALPTFYKPRFDNLQTRLYPYFYEDLDATWLRAQDPGNVDPRCVEGSAQPQQNCNVISDTLVPPHDYDRFTPGPRLGPELWSAYWPVGVSGSANDYAAFAAQLSPYLDKLLAFYSGQLKSNGRYYFVSNDPGWQQLELLWNTAGPSQIDFYGKPGPQGEVGESCLSGGQNLCYVRWPLETYASFADFEQTYQGLPFVGEGWQEPSIFSAAMNAALYDVVEVNAPTSYDLAIVSTQAAAQLTQAGLVVALSGSSDVGFAPPRAGTTVDIANVLPSDSVGVAYLYGKSRALAVMGDPTNRGHYANYPVVYSALKTGAAGYLGAAHRARMQQNFADAGYDQCIAASGTNCGYTLSENASEMLLGDPFLDLN